MTSNKINKQTRKPTDKKASKQTKGGVYEGKM